MNRVFVGKVSDPYSIDAEESGLLGCCKVKLCHIP